METKMRKFTKLALGALMVAGAVNVTLSPVRVIGALVVLTWAEVFTSTPVLPAPEPAVRRHNEPPRPERTR